ncbi:MAG TPA: hypothetical protein HPP41_00075 [Deltaproteobacteria bacterium]|nr:hypothetical protein [Deltaproteobacteria bacterium]
MSTTDELKEKEDSEVNELVKKSVWETLQDIEERTEQVLRQGTTQSPTGIAGEPIMPKIKGLEILKEDVYGVDMEKTVNDMFMVIKNMEAQLEKVLAVNSLLEKDLNEAKEMMADLKEAKSQLEATIALMEEEIPSKRELQIEIDQLIEERNSAQTGIHEMNSKIEKLQEAIVEYQKGTGDLEEEKRDVITEINFLESRLNVAAEKIATCENEINVLKGERLAHVEKIKALEEDLNEALDDKHRLINELKRSKKAVTELHSVLSDKKLKAKKSFYKTKPGRAVTKQG